MKAFNESGVVETVHAGCGAFALILYFVAGMKMVEVLSLKAAMGYEVFLITEPGQDTIVQGSHSPAANCTQV